MPKAHVLVTVEGGVAHVDVLAPGLVVEVRDFDVQESGEGEEFMWTNEDGDRCWRYFVGDEREEDQP